MTETTGGTVIIAGAGIAGLACAAMLARSGWAVRVFERADSFGEVGAGLQMSPNAARVLEEIGILGRVEAASVLPETAIMRDGQTGAEIFRAELGALARARWGAPYLHVHRADLHAALLSAAEGFGATIETGVGATGYSARPEGARVTLSDGRAETGTLAIGADGIRSALRTELNGPEDPVFTGQVAWRGTLPAERVPESLRQPVATVWVGPGRHLVTYLLRRGTLVNFVAVEEVSDWTEEGWSAPGDPAVLAAAYAGWHDDVTALLGAVQETFRWGLFARPAQVRWVDRSLALVGDAAHPMLPFMAQGAAMAIEDAAVLDRCLAEPGEIETRLRAFEDTRWHRVEKVQTRSRLNGQLYHQRSKLGQAVFYMPLSLANTFAPGLLTRQLDWIYGYNPLAAR